MCSINETDNSFGSQTELYHTKGMTCIWGGTQLIPVL